MNRLHVFTDASVDSKLHVGFGAYLALAETGLDLIEDMQDMGPADSPGGGLKLKKFTATAPTQLEIETVLWALGETMAQASGIILYTDSQSIINLPRRRAALEKSGFISAATGKVLNHAALYRAFYQMHDRLGFKLVKLKGHLRRADKTRLDLVFSYVDKATRKALREYRKQNP